ncbi:MAG: vWA domain-containing protein [Pseudomonadota bacterium]
MLPFLEENQSVDPAAINGVSLGQLTAMGDQNAVITYKGGDAAFDSGIGYYVIETDGSISSTNLIFVSQQDTAEDQTFDLGTFPDGTQLGLFMVRDAANQQDELGIDLTTGSLEFRTQDGDPANVNDTNPPKLVHIADDSTETVYNKPLFHTADNDASTLDTNALNFQGFQQVLSVTENGATTIAFEDVQRTTGDMDFNDLVFNFEFGSDGSTPSSPPSPPQPPETTQKVSSEPVELPDGQDVAVSITTETTTGDDVAELTGSLSLTGFLASDFNIAYIMDTSGSTGAIATDGQFNAIDLNGDGFPDSVFEAEQAAFAELNDQLEAAGLGGANLGVIPFASLASLDTTTKIGSDADGNGFADGVDAINNPSSVGGGTNFEPPLQEAINFFNAQDDVDTATNVVYFLSDGFASTFSLDDELDTLTDPNGIDAIINAIGATSGADEVALDVIDNTGTSQIVTDLSQLAAGLSASSLDINDIVSVDISVNGAVQQSLDSSAFTDTPTGPQFGPVTLTGLDPKAVNTVDIEAELQTADGSIFELNLMTEIIGVDSSLDMTI